MEPAMRTTEKASKDWTKRGQIPVTGAGPGAAAVWASTGAAASATAARKTHPCGMGFGVMGRILSGEGRHHRRGAEIAERGIEKERKKCERMMSPRWSRVPLHRFFLCVLCASAVSLASSRLVEVGIGGIAGDLVGAAEPAVEVGEAGALVG